MHTYYALRPTPLLDNFPLIFRNLKFEYMQYTLSQAFIKVESLTSSESYHENLLSQKNVKFVLSPGKAWERVWYRTCNATLLQTRTQSVSELENQRIDSHWVRVSLCPLLITVHLIESYSKSITEKTNLFNRRNVNAWKKLKKHWKETNFILKYETCLKKLCSLSLEQRRVLVDDTFLYEALNGMINGDIQPYIDFNSVHDRYPLGIAIT